MRLPILIVALAAFASHAEVVPAGETETRSDAKPVGEAESVDLSAFNDNIHHFQMNRERPYPQHKPTELRPIADNMLLHQNPDGGWSKNIDPLRKLTDPERAKLQKKRSGRSTLDNRTTWSHVDYLARVNSVIPDKRYQEAARRGIGYILKEQRQSGGWRGADVDAITFNDDVMAGVLATLKRIVDGEPHYQWLDDARRRDARQAFDRGIQCILRCQVKQDGRLTAWGQQHSHKTFKPVGARSFERASLTACESVGVVRLLMSIEKPSPEIVRSVHAAATWLEQVKIEGVRVDTIEAENTQFPYRISTTDRVVVKDKDAPPIWARFYQLDDNRPFFCNRDGKKVYTLAEVKRERRDGYAWYGYWPSRLLQREYPAWAKEHPPTKSTPAHRDRKEKS